MEMSVVTVVISNELHRLEKENGRGLPLVAESPLPGQSLRRHEEGVTTPSPLTPTGALFPSNAPGQRAAIVAPAKMVRRRRR